jgi:hypothetical protein
LDNRCYQVSYAYDADEVAVLNETTDRWCCYQIGKKGHWLWDVHRDKTYDDKYPQGAVPVMVKCTGRATSITIPPVDPQLLDKGEIPNISSTFMEFVNELGRLGERPAEERVRIQRSATVVRMHDEVRDPDISIRRRSKRQTRIIRMGSRQSAGRSI